jgi:ethanolamine utilization protein EutN
MKTGIVAGQVWATKRLDELPGGALLEIDIEEKYPGDERLIAFDPLGAGIGERVLVTQGSVAKGWFKNGNAVVDALVIGILDVHRPQPKKRP